MVDKNATLREIQDDLLSVIKRIGAVTESEDEFNTTNFDTSPGERLTRFRSRKGLTQAQLAEISGVAINTIINFERGHSKPRTRTTMRLAEALDVNYQDLT